MKLLPIAAIALVSAMLGGVFGIAVWRAIDKRNPKPAPREQLGWFCSSHVCHREHTQCETLAPANHPTPRIECAAQRIAFCPMNTEAVIPVACTPTWALCMSRMQSGDWKALCVGVE